MIRINLAPPTETADKLWFVPELSLFLFFFALTWTVTQVYLTSIEAETSEIQSQITEFRKNIENLKPDIDKFAQMTKQIDLLKEKIRSVQKITTSKTSRYLPVILLEHLQTFKPEGLWFNSVKQDSHSSKIHLSGGSFDNLLISEFMASLDGTKKQEYNPLDLKSSIYFPHVTLEGVSSEGISSQTKTTEPTKVSDAQIAFAKTKQQGQATSSQSSESSNKNFPELSKFPTFSLSIDYAEHDDDRKETVTGKAL